MANGKKGKGDGNSGQGNQTAAKASVWLPFSLHIPSGAGGVAASGEEVAAGRGVVEAWLVDAQVGYSLDLPPDQRTIPATLEPTVITSIEKTDNPESPEGFCVDTKADEVADFKADPPQDAPRP